MKAIRTCFLFLSVLLLVGLIFSNGSVAAADRIVIDDFEDGLDPKWREKVFEGKTIYESATEGGRRCLRAKSSGSASGMIYELEYDIGEYPVLSWSWFVKSPIAKGDERTKEGDDYAARVYIVFPSILPWRTKAINYIWANILPKGTMQSSAYTDNSVMVAVESGSHGTGTWINEERNVLEDYKKAFGSDPPKAGAIAIMTDTDNTGGHAQACYGPILISRESVVNGGRSVPSSPPRCRPTPHDEIGPFYRPGAPLRNKIGEGYVLRGVVRNADTCLPVSGARIELWMAGSEAEYDDAHRATVIAGDRGDYYLESDFPPPYSGRPPHIHILVTAFGFERLITQHYPALGVKSAEMDLVLEPANVK